MDNLRSEKLLARKSSERFSTLTKVLAKLGIWLASVVSIVALLWGAHLGLQRLFFTANPHFILRDFDVEVVNGTIDAESIPSRLNITRNVTNLYAIDLAAIRQQLVADPVIREAEVRRFLPDILQIRVYGRAPVAQLLSVGGQMVDRDGVVLDAVQRAEYEQLPVITPLPRATTYDVGDVIREPGVVCALQVLQELQTNEQGKWLDVYLIQLVDSQRELHIRVHARPGQYITEGAVFILPMKDVIVALNRVFETIKTRSQAGQPISKANFTYDRAWVEP